MFVLYNFVIVTILYLYTLLLAPNWRFLSNYIFLWEQKTLLHCAHYFLVPECVLRARTLCFQLCNIHLRWHAHGLLLCFDKYEPLNFTQFGNEQSIAILNIKSHQFIFDGINKSCKFLHTSFHFQEMRGNIRVHCRARPILHFDSSGSANLKSSARFVIWHNVEILFYIFIVIMIYEFIVLSIDDVTCDVMPGSMHTHHSNIYCSFPAVCARIMLGQ